jgi:hypothetical protein
LPLDDEPNGSLAVVPGNYVVIPIIPGASQASNSPTARLNPDSQLLPSLVLSGGKRNHRTPRSGRDRCKEPQDAPEWARPLQGTKDAPEWA